jgi:hypothetical protein
MNSLRSLEHWDRGFESYSRHGCVFAFIVLLCSSCVGSGLATGWSPVQGILPTVLGLRNWNETKRFTDAPCGSNRKERDRDRALYTALSLIHPKNVLWGSEYFRSTQQPQFLIRQNLRRLQITYFLNNSLKKNLILGLVENHKLKKIFEICR